eukprot:Opistho-2@2761
MQSVSLAHLKSKPEGHPVCKTDQPHKCEELHQVSPSAAVQNSATSKRARDAVCVKVEPNLSGASVDGACALFQPKRRRNDTPSCVPQIKQESEFKKEADDQSSANEARGSGDGAAVAVLSLAFVSVLKHQGSTIVRYYRRFCQDDAELLSEMRSQIDWQTRSVRIIGKWIPQPRQVALASQSCDICVASTYFRTYFPACIFIFILCINLHLCICLCARACYAQCPY